MTQIYANIHNLSHNVWYRTINVVGSNTIQSVNSRFGLYCYFQGHVGDHVWKNGYNYVVGPELICGITEIQYFEDERLCPLRGCIKNDHDLCMFFFKTKNDRKEFIEINNIKTMSPADWIMMVKLSH